ncbi:MAG: DUF262 domain-containing protein [Gammaproteobacteria bacterium AqS3]|nr:DUF262 domain-containing protein [Gammaproteobacteria bacterium AqS3]
MKAEIQSVEKTLAFLGGAQYYIPSYQRPYIWDKDQAEELLQDVHNSCAEKQGEYFIGGLICIRDGNRFEVVDGQQRLITLTLILRELVRVIENNEELKKNNEGLKAKLRSMYLNEDHISANRLTRPVIEVRDKERGFYTDQVLREEIKQKPEKDTDTEKVFRNNSEAIQKFLKEDLTLPLNRLVEYLLRQVYVVFVEVDDRESSFRMFHVLNNRGQSLSDADLIKSVLLEKVASNEDKSLKVENNWKTIEENIGIENINSFLRLNLFSEMKDRDRANKPKLYPYYTDQLKQNDSGNIAVSLSASLAKSAELHAEILNDDPPVIKTIELLSEIGGRDEWLPAFMAFRIKFADWDLFAKFVDLFERTYVQASLRDEHKNKREAARYHAVEAINSKDATFEKVMNSIRNLSAEGNQKWKFEDVLDKQDFYDGSRPRVNKFIKSILQRLDETYEDESVERKYKGNITIEHILPQNIKGKDYWTERFSEEQHEQYRNMLGNLTLLSRRKNGVA